jgi:S-adenosylmethionine hydrolase
LFAPAAAHLALGVPLDSFGPPIEPRELTAIEWPPAIVRQGELETTIIYRDTFGNMKLAALPSDLVAALPGLAYGETLTVTLGGERDKASAMAWAPTFGEVEPGGYLLYEDSYGRLCIAQNQGNAVQSLNVSEGTPVRISRQATE